jgi:DNA-3-methyladenine glycosylase II
MNSAIALSHFKMHDPKIHAVLETINFADWFEELHEKDHFKSLVSTIIGQQLSGKAANTIRGRVIEKLPNNTITPKNIMDIKDEDLRSAGMSWAKVRSVKDLSQKVLEGDIDPSNLDHLANEEIIKELTSVKGIGVWTAEMFLIFNLGREDVFSYGDVGLKNGIELLYDVKKPTMQQIETITSPWSPYRSFGCIALWHTVDNRK